MAIFDQIKAENPDAAHILEHYYRLEKTYRQALRAMGPIKLTYPVSASTIKKINISNDSTRAKF